MKIDANDIARDHGPAGLAAVLDRETAAAPDLCAPKAEPWPKLAPAALHGLAGEIVRTIEPHTEGDPVALLVQLLVAFGNAIGRKPFWRVGGDRHHTNLFAVLVGKSSKGRKGTSWSEVKRLFDSRDDAWNVERVKSGASSSEGIIWAVRDPANEDDTGVDDKRLVLMEPEFSKVLKQTERNGNTLSALLRDAWDNGTLETLTKNSPARATGAHVSIVGHITQPELLRTLGDTEISNGFGNRFLWLLVKRSKSLPMGGYLSDMELALLRGKLSAALVFARDCGEVKRTAAADKLWCKVYERLTEEKDGLAASLTSRAEAQTMRLALLYALLDCSPEIDRPHLEAALALWGYCEQSTSIIFGNALGDPVADQIADALQNSEPIGLTRSQINDLFGGHRRASEISRALAALLKAGLAKPETTATAGRPQEVWHHLIR